MSLITACHLFHQLVIRYSWRHRWVACLNLLSVGLGVAVYLAIQIANHSASEAFRAGVDVVSGKSHLEVRADGGQVDETTLKSIRESPLVEAVTPVVEGFATLADFPGEYLRVLGVDIFTIDEFRTSEWSDDQKKEGQVINWQSFMMLPRQLMVSPELAAIHGWEKGDVLRLQIDDEIKTVTLSGFHIPMGEMDSGGTGRNLASMAIGGAQELFAMPGKFTSLQVRVKDPDSLDELVGQLAKEVPPDVRVDTPMQRTRQIGKMIQGFQLNLTALSLVSMLVGMFLIYNTVSASVVRRRREIGMLRSLGVTKLQIQMLFLGESLLVGLLGVALGIAGGIVLGNSLLSGVAQTISTLYVLVSIDTAYYSGWHLLQAAGFGMLACLAGAWLPAREASRMEPGEVVRVGAAQMGGQRFPSGRLAIAGGTALLIASLLAFVSLRFGPAWLSFVACFFLLSGFAMLAPAVSSWGAGGLAAACRRCPQRMAGQGMILFQLALSAFQRSLHRTGVTVAGLMTAVAMMIGVTIMISSFRETVVNWMDRTLVADLYLAPASQEVIGSQDAVSPELRTFLQSQPEVAAADSLLSRRATLADGRSVRLGVIDSGVRGNLAFVGGEDEVKERRLFEERTVIVSEPFLQKYMEGARPSHLEILTPEGTERFPVAGVFYDYSQDQGLVFMSRKTFDAYWDDPREQSLAVYLKPEAQTKAAQQALMDRVRARFSEEDTLLILSNRELRERALTIFDQTFAVTDVLRGVAVIVAVLGIVLALTTLVQERVREIGIMRAIGGSRWQLATLYMGEATVIGVFSAIIGGLCGVALALILTWVVNQAFFGWTVVFRVPWRELMTMPLWVSAVAAVAGIIPAWQASRQAIAGTLRSE